MRTSLRLPVVAAMLAGGLVAGDLPYVGKWKLNPARSDFGETTISYEPARAGEIKATADGLSYTFKADGKNYPTPWGATTACRSVDSATWECTNRANGTVISVERLAVSADGKALTIHSKTTMATGESSSNSMTFQRMTGSQGLMGKWKTKNVTIGSPGVIEIAARGGDGLMLTYVDEKGVCDAKFDGKDYPAAGPMWPKGWTCRMAKSSDRAFEVVWKNASATYRNTYTVSLDGRSLTDHGGASTTNEKVRVVYDRQ